MTLTRIFAVFGDEDSTMNDTKSKWQSKTLWGAIVLAGIAIARGFGLEMTESDSAEVQHAVEGIILGAISLWTIYGRLTAKHKLK